MPAECEKRGENLPLVSAALEAEAGNRGPRDACAHAHEIPGHA